MALDPAIALAILEAAAGMAAYSPPSVEYLAALTSAPDDADQGTECAGDGYGRCAIYPATLMSLVDDVPTSNSDVVFDVATADWPDDIVAIASYPDAGDTANRRWYYVLDTPVTVAIGHSLRIPAGDLTFQYPSEAPAGVAKASVKVRATAKPKS